MSIESNKLVNLADAQVLYNDLRDRESDLKSAFNNIGVNILSGGTGTSNSSVTFALDDIIYALDVYPFTARTGLQSSYYVLQIVGTKANSTDVYIVNETYSQYDGTKKHLVIDNRNSIYVSLTIRVRAENGTSVTVNLYEDLQTYFGEITAKNASDISKNEILANHGMAMAEVNNIVIGTINTSTGAESVNSKRARTGYIKVNNANMMFNKTGFKAALYSYTTNDVSGFISPATDQVNGNIQIPSTASYVRIVFQKQDDSNFTDSDLQTIYPNAYLQYVEPIENRIDCTFVRGGIDEVTAQETGSYARARSGWIISHSDILIENDSGMTARVYLYTYNKKLVKVIDEESTSNIQHNGYVRFVLKKTDSSNFDATDFNNANNNFKIVRHENSVPSYWNEYLFTKYNSIKNNGLAMRNRGDGFIFATDIHYENNELRSPLLMKKIIQNTNVNKIVIGGDVINGNADKDKAIGMLESWIGLFDDTPFTLAYGNHDTNTSIGSSTTENAISNGEVYDLATRQLERFINTDAKTHFYFDNTSQKIRFFVLNTGDGYTPQTSKVDDPITYSDELTWLSNNIADIDSDWNIIVIQHLFFNPASIESGNNITVSQAYGEPLMDVLDAINADQSKPNVFAVIVGHVHRNHSILANGGYYCIATTCDAGGTSSSTYDSDTPTRTKGTTNEQAFDVFQFDIKNKKIYATRIGAGQDREWSYT